MNVFQGNSGSQDANDVIIFFLVINRPYCRAHVVVMFSLFLCAFLVENLNETKCLTNPIYIVKHACQFQFREPFCISSKIECCGVVVFLIQEWWRGTT